MSSAIDDPIINSPFRLRDEDRLREVMNTVGKAGKLGEGVRCVVSVSMLTDSSSRSPAKGARTRPRR